MHQVRSGPVIENWILPLVPHPTLMYAVVFKYVVRRFMSSLLLCGSICALTKLVCLLVQVSHVQSSGVNVPACEAAPESLADAAGQRLVMPTSRVATPAAASGFLAGVAVMPYDDQHAAALDQACQVQMKIQDSTRDTKHSSLCCSCNILVLGPGLSCTCSSRHCEPSQEM